MALQSSGQISLGDIRAELGQSGEIRLNDADVRGLIGKSSGARNQMSEYYGASAFDASLPDIFVVKFNNTIYMDSIQGTVSGGGTLRIEHGGSNYPGSIRWRRSTASSYTAWYTGTSQAVSVNDGDTIHLQWEHGSTADANITLKDDSDGSVLDTSNFHSESI